MASSPIPDPFDPAEEARRLARLFSGFSNTVDEFRLGLPDGTQADQLKAQAQSLEDQSHKFTASAIGATLSAVQKDLSHIKTVTSDAKDQLGVLKDVSKIIAIVGFWLWIWEPLSRMGIPGRS